MNILLIFPGFIVAFIIVLYYERKIRNLSAKPKNKARCYAARDKDGLLWLYLGKPFRNDNQFGSTPDKRIFPLTFYDFESLGINEEDYANLKWEDEPVEVFINMED